jgi:hypothetical protein
MNDKQLQLSQQIAGRFAQLPEVEAVALAGSLMGSMGEALSDLDIYIYVQHDIPAEVRSAIGAEYSDSRQINDYWGPGMEWDDPQTGLHVDSMYFTTAFMEEQLARVLDRHEAWMGYTTAFWHTVRISKVLFDRSGWFEKLHEKAQQPYPDALVRAIVQQNYPVLRDTYSSYLVQLKKAAARNDLVSLNHRAAALLAGYFDILFAVNRQTHPGEKRLIAQALELCPKRPSRMREHIQAFLLGTTDTRQSIENVTNVLIDGLEDLLNAEGLL